ncbi:related to HSP30 heat shock protein Yro1p [Ramularia collo-cygni]|uniref:Related to HSP30 heat shock protein Yro1p n=1 Tax=Ramularia collo-cygni TaxID=112498 RepID=A0A2D3UMV1_9PEZI|nr:related to HSP30 heat shock protein Yro1p [Ramularia collo-cygni]CZT14318.1 related to HSP30 heat shock protein Yro1p [Ramularia collo-cygni]
MVNNAIYNNPPYANGRLADIHITEDGSDYYYAYCAFSGFMAILILGLARRKRRTDRIFYYLCATINIMMCLSYYAMGSNLGMTPIDVEFHRTWPRVRGDAREIFWVRYVQWFINTPLILSILLLPTSLPAPKFLFTLFLNQTMIIMGLVGAVTSTKYKWGFFGFGCAALFYVLFTLLFSARKHARRHGKEVTRIYMIGIIYQFILWICYPICWGVSDGGNVIAPDSEAVYYGILDILAVPFFSIMVLILTRKLDLAALGLRSHDYDDEIGEIVVGHEKKRGATGPMLGPIRRSSSSIARGGPEVLDHPQHTHGNNTTGGLDVGNNTGNATAV